MDLLMMRGVSHRSEKLWVMAYVATHFSHKGQKSMFPMSSDITMHTRVTGMMVRYTAYGTMNITPHSSPHAMGNGSPAR